MTRGGAKRVAHKDGKATFDDKFVARVEPTAKSGGAKRVISEAAKQASFCLKICRDSEFAADDDRPRWSWR